MKLADIERIMNSSSAENWNTQTFSQSGAKMVSAYCDDVLLRVEISFLPEDAENEDFRETWANNFPDKKAASYRARLHYGATFLKSYLLVSVDGGRALIPLPDKEALTVGNDQYLVASLFDSSDSLSQYMERVGITLK